VFLSLVGEPKNTRLGPSVSFISEFLCEKYDFDPYKGFFLGKKKRPKFARFQRKEIPESPYFYDKIHQVGGQENRRVLC
jgi:hypothetical protein